MDDKNILLREVRGFKSSTERDISSYSGEGFNIDGEIPLKSLVSMDEQLISLYINILYNNKIYSFYLDYDGRLSIYEDQCGIFGTETSTMIPIDSLLLTIYFDIIPFLIQNYNQAVNNGWEQEERAYKKDLAIDVISELMDQNNIIISDISENRR